VPEACGSPSPGAPIAWSTETKEAALSTESIARPSLPATGAAETCAACGAALADDQRYCLECGERSIPMSSVLLGGPPSGGVSQSQSQPPPTAPPGYGSAPADGGTRGSAVTVIAGVGVLLLAMGVGVLIGRSSASSKPSATPAQVITVAQPGAAAGAPSTPTTTPTAPEASAKGGSPTSKSGSKQGGSGAGASKGSGGASSGGSGKNTSPATPKTSSSGGGKSYEEKSKNLPNVVSTG